MFLRLRTVENSMLEDPGPLEPAIPFSLTLAAHMQPIVRAPIPLSIGLSPRLAPVIRASVPLSIGVTGQLQ